MRKKLLIVFLPMLMLLMSSVAYAQTPTINVVNELNMGIKRNGKVYTDSLKITAQNLTADITVSVDKECKDLVLSETTISMFEAMSENGKWIYLTLKPTQKDVSDVTFTFSSAGAKDTTCWVYWEPDIYQTRTNVADFYALAPTFDPWGEFYMLDAKVEITLIDGANYYIQDKTGAMTMQDDYEWIKSAEEGDILTNGLVGYFDPDMALNGNVPFYLMEKADVEKGDLISPVSVTLADIKADPAKYVKQLVKLSGVDIVPVDGNTTFDTDLSKRPTIKQGDVEAKLRILKERDYVGQTIPAKADVVGVITSATASSIILTPRSMADFYTSYIFASEPELDFFMVRAGKTYTDTIFIKGESLSADIALSVDNEDITLSDDTVSMTDAQTEKGKAVVVTLNPTVSGLQNAVLTLKSKGAEDLHVNLYWDCEEVKIYTSVADLRQEIPNAADYFGSLYLNAQVTISLVNDGVYYVEDETGGLAVKCNEDVTLDESYAEGKKFGGLYGYFMPETNDNITVNYFLLSDMPEAATDAEELVPQEVALEEISMSRGFYEARLVKLTNVIYNPAEGMTKFEAGKDVAVLQSRASSNIAVLEGRDFIGYEIPEEGDVVGVLLDVNGARIAPRNKEDLGIKDAPAGVDVNELSSVVWTNGLNLYVEKDIDTLVEVYSVTGIKIASSYNNVIALPAEGIYIVKVANDIHKIIVK